jgi:hypothetical protein
MVLPLAMGAVVDGVVQTPLSGHLCPVEAVMPIGDLAVMISP